MRIATWNPLRKVLENRNGGHLTQLLAVITASITLFSAGLYQGWGTPSLPKLMSDEYPHDISTDQSSYIIIMGQIGHVIGGFSASFLSDIIGRKKTILAIALPQIVSWSLIYLSYHHITLLYLARVFGGMSEGAPIALVPSYIAEVAAPEVRGKLGVFITLTVCSGILFINTVGSFLSIGVTALVCLIFTVIFLILFSNMPESPYYLLRTQKDEEARQVLQILRRKENVEKELLQLTEDVAHQLKQKGTFKDLIVIPANRKAFTVVTLARIFQISTGLSVFVSYNQILISQSTNMSPFVGTTIILIANISTVALTSTYIEKVKRKTILAVSAFFTSLTLFSQAIFLSIRDYTTIDTSSVSWLPVLIMAFFNISLCAGLASILNIYIGEIYSTSIKPKALSLGSVTYAITSMITIKFYQYTADNIGLVVPFYVFGSITFIGTFFFYFLLPETKGKTLENIQRELGGEKIEFPKNVTQNNCI